MARRRVYADLRVLLNGRDVGILSREANGAVSFQYAAEWLNWPATFPISLSLPLREQRYIGAPVLNVFDNLLPDNDQIRRRIAERVGADGADAYSLLSVLGRDCVGALQFLAEDAEVGIVGSSDGAPIDDDAIGVLIANLAVSPLGLEADGDFRISIAGAQEKTALLRKDGQWFKPTGTAATTHILKPQIGMLPNGVDLTNSVENEYLCLKLLAAFGVPAAHSDIADFGGRRTLVVERFDRRWGADGRLLRLPQEDICQALSVPPTRKYQTEGGPGLVDILDLLKGSDQPIADMTTFMRSAVIFWLIGATDGHAKNFSIFLGPGGRFRLTPLYDVLSAQPSVDDHQIRKNAFKLAMSVGQNRHYAVDEIAPRHFQQTAERAGLGLSIVNAIFEDLAANATGIAERVARDLPATFPEVLVVSLLSGISRRALRLTG
jgi:serine/threonine-protein kinase HipA